MLPEYTHKIELTEDLYIELLFDFQVIYRPDKLDKIEYRIDSDRLQVENKVIQAVKEFARNHYIENGLEIN